MKSTTKLSIAATALSLITMGSLTALTYAAEDTIDQNSSIQRPDRELVKTSIENGDYNAWAELMKNHPNAEEFVTAENFALLQQAHELMEAGDKEGAKELLQNSNLPHPKHNKQHGQMSEVKSAIENGDYNAWAELMKDHPNAEEFVTAENFALLQQAHELMEAGDKEGAKELLQNSNIPMPQKRGHKQGSLKGNSEQREDIKTAIEAGDYNAWAELMKDHPNAEEFITPENFETIQQIHELKEAGNHEEARELREQLKQSA